jgi:hypothetical protein
MAVLCRLGFHRWPRVHGSFRAPVVEPMTGRCVRCQKVIYSIWHHVFPQDGSRCKPGACAIHDESRAQALSDAR